MKQTIVILGVVLMSSLFFACNSENDETNEKSATSETTEKTETDKTSLIETSFTVHGSCGMCKDRIENAAKTVEGVKKAEWNMDKQTLSLKYAENVNLENVHKVIAEAGHDTEMMTADDDVYKNLPGCCKYRDLNE
jgi:Cu(I)/Ag(I) efflux system membrane fusion protein